MPSGFVTSIHIGREVRRIAGVAGRGNVKGAVLHGPSLGSEWAYTLRDNTKGRWFKPSPGNR